MKWPYPGLPPTRCCAVGHGTTACNRGATAPASGVWVNITTDVPDGTRFGVRVYKRGPYGVTHSGVMDF